ncbi:hypothetical protein SAMN05660690_3614 [Geodermatophilus telluris]|uniref:Uncharacterized protein n=1 Tax=Geodermatophilus telluris TaxID=1190417 RepID=A0A1G6SHI4_9ACTN|nr:hypothetical protein [Geodermatophilus telluris]SDD16253.1 hypothetical protein SAMN05660690_3614 [Geodermatophilus telluris]
MSQLPEGMPVLSRGRHRSPVRGACFLEYTSLLAGEPFSDEPACVDGELAAVLRHANDTLSAAARQRLVPLLGRAIGLAVPEPAVAPRRGRARRSAWDVRALAAYAGTVAALRENVARRFTAALGLELPAPEWRGVGRGRDLDRLFWSLMTEPTAVSTSAAWGDRLVGRLVLLHECYEQAMDELGLVRPAAEGQLLPS